MSVGAALVAASARPVDLKICIGRASATQLRNKLSCSVSLNALVSKQPIMSGAS
jgi:hypothetical protein